MVVKKWNLQFFSEEKTEQPTEKKKSDARKKGQVAQSKDVPAALSLIIVTLTIQLTSGYFTNHMMELYMTVSEWIPHADDLYNVTNLTRLLAYVLLKIILIIAPVLLAALVTGVMGSYFQVGFLFSLKAIQPKFSKLSPISGFKRLFSMKSVVEMVKAIAKGTILIYIAYSYLIKEMSAIVQSIELNLYDFVALMWNIVINITMRCAAFLLFVSVIDLVYKRWEHNKDLKMSKKEIKDEYKQSEGDPMLKGKIREKQRSMAMSRMMQDVPDADVVITNPTHFAVAIKYDSSVGVSPKVVAKGQNLIAQNIKRVAKENGVVVVENKPLARALFAGAEIGDFIPVDLYQAVAEVLAYVYGLKEKDAR